MRKFLFLVLGLNLVALIFAGIWVGDHWHKWYPEPRTKPDLEDPYLWWPRAQAQAQAGESADALATIRKAAMEFGPYHQEELLRLRRLRWRLARPEVDPRALQTGLVLRSEPAGHFARCEQEEWLVGGGCDSDGGKGWLETCQPAELGTYGHRPCHALMRKGGEWRCGSKGAWALCVEAL